MRGSYSPDPGEIESAKCGICGDEMDVKRGVFGPTGFAESMSGRGHRHDRFTCPNLDTDWHRQVDKLQIASKETPSVKLGDMFEDEAKEIIKSRVATKKVSRFF